MTGTVLVTGGLGRSGRWICDCLADAGWDVVCVDVDHPGFEVDQRPNVDFRAADLTDRGQALDLAAELDPDAVVHWAAIPVPLRHPDGQVFETNVEAAYNTLTAAGRAGADVVLASSESYYGFPFSEGQDLPDYLPIDEDHPARPEDPYGLSKVTSEEIGKAIARKHGVSVAAIRPTWIQYPGEYTALLSQDDLGPADGNFWSYVDVRDVADMVRLALESSLDGFEAFLCVADENVLGRPTAEVIEEYYGTLPEKCDLDGEACAFTNEKAKAVLGWHPRHTWRDAKDEHVPDPDLYGA
ncbi:NAD(P)-dependent oxidoreductase [Haloarculaceae archaeon H-GB2-1]|nr:NAD(P)-dependent oxidoreductase [Haloarculaceae archaeon H-GB1-1]MEA5388998.1 NAD(P)-dependent oxidoreductase [Haloarculaceae archaeon H-GB11]MEA5407057.1 NAD(P)-dependent oxidoreductase [Haloarculaceae archaeon H-GB2-1]